MPCGCDNNKNLNKDKLRLDGMKDMSIDEIVNLYRQGYVLESTKTEFQNGDILSLTSNPNITDVAAFYDDRTGKVTIMVLWRNSGSSGYVNILALDGTSLLDSSIECVDPRTTPFNYLTHLEWQGQVNIVDVLAKSCTSGENCTTWPYTCTTENTVSSNLSNGVYTINVSEPTAPVGTITPLNGALRITWSPSTGADIFSYEVIIWLQGNYVLLPIYTQSNIRDITIDGLTNGVTYDIWITGKSRYNIDSWPNWQGSGIPTVPTPVLTTIAISPTSPSINVGATQQLAAICKDQNNNTMTCPTLSWLSSNPAIASVNSSGLVTGVSAGGPVNITASASGKTSNVSAITITPPAQVLTTIAISPTTPSIGIGGLAVLNAVCKDQNNNTMTCTTLTWTSSNPAIATIDPSAINPLAGLVTGVSPGSVNMTASAGGVTSNISTVIVTGTISILTSIAISPTTTSIAPLATKQFTVICKDQGNNAMTCPTLTWTSSNPTVATVNSTGLATGITIGTTNITTSAEGITSMATMTVTTTPPSTGTGGAMMIAAIAAIGIAYYIMKKPKKP